jgi:hypothetical protein
MPCVARGSPSLMPVSGAWGSPLSGAAAGRPCRPPRAHLPVGAAPPAAGAAIACLGGQLAGASAAGGGRAAWHCQMPALPLSATPRGATMRPARARSNRTTRRWSTPGLGRHRFSEPASPRARGRGEGRQSTKDVSVQFRITILYLIVGWAEAIFGQNEVLSTPQVPPTVVTARAGECGGLS